MSTLGDALPKEITRCKELLCLYKDMGPAGFFGAGMINNDIVTAEKAIADNDLVAQAQIYEKLKQAE